MYTQMMTIHIPKNPTPFESVPSTSYPPSDQFASVQFTNRSGLQFLQLSRKTATLMLVYIYVLQGPLCAHAFPLVQCKHTCARVRCDESAPTEISSCITVVFPNVVTVNQIRSSNATSYRRYFNSSLHAQTQYNCKCKNKSIRRSQKGQSALIKKKIEYSKSSLSIETLTCVPFQ